MKRKQESIYGPYRTVKPEGTLPNLAWKLDNSLPIRADEMLIDVRVINVNAASFGQIAVECGNDPLQIARKITSIVSLRGKLHNPITGTGGTLMGIVEEIGPEHPQYGKVKKGDAICTLASTSMTPLAIDSIQKVNMNTRQIAARGHAILFRDSIFAKVPEGWNPNIFLAIVGEAGSCCESAVHCSTGSTVVLLGASEKVGIMSMFSIREKLGSSGRLIAVTRKAEQYEALKALGVTDQIIVSDFRKPLSALKEIRDRLKDSGIEEVDYTVDCSNTPGHEMLGILLTKECGTVYFANPAVNYSEASLGAEGIGKEIDIFFYRGYLKGHVDYCIKLTEKNPVILKWFSKRYSDDDRKGVYTIPDKKILSKENELGLPNVIVSGQEMANIVGIANRIADFNTTVLIEGESGTGKEVVADIMQQLSIRKEKPYIKINCAAVSDSLFESEFFGYDAGAFTGALRNGKAGYFEMADKGTLFLDEIGDLSLQNQVKLLRVLQSREVVRVGSALPRKIDVRLIAATNKNLKEMVEKGEFRQDLYYRLNVINIHIPALREREDDIQPFIENFTMEYNELYHMNKSFDGEAMHILKSYRWPGNVREMENLIQRLILTVEGEMICAEDIPMDIRDSVREGLFTSRADSADSTIRRILVRKNKERSQGMAEDKKYSLKYKRDIRSADMYDSESNYESDIDSRLMRKSKSGSESGSESGSSEKEMYLEAAGKYRTTREIAEALNTSQSTVVRKLKKYGIERKIKVGRIEFD
ncbi:MAG: sigma 54-interacting transcriptional regulator [Clostridiales bacterium]|nr:sigma 54-interacting transcriptional regulator [Clostridiales bacterium]